MPSSPHWKACTRGSRSTRFATRSTCRIISKTAAADYTAGLFPEYSELLARAKRHRLGDDSLVFTVADGRAACDLIDTVVADAARLA